MNTAEVAAALDVPEQAVRAWCSTGVLPATGDVAREVDPEDLDAWRRRPDVVALLASLRAEWRSALPDEELVAERAP